MDRRILLIGLLCAIIASLLMPADAEAKKKKKVVRYQAEFTAYYPSDSTMEGGYKDAVGRPLDPSEYVIAAPKCFPIGTKVKFGGIGDWRDGHTYEVRDRGQAIVVEEDGLVHIDILMATYEQTDDFGRVRGWIEVEE